jgi:hypothetical protein
MSLYEIFSLLFIDLLKIMAVIMAYTFGKQMVNGRYDPDRPPYTFWQKAYTYVRGLFGCVIGAMFLGIGSHFKITNITIEVFLLLAIPCFFGIMESYNKDERKFKQFKRNDP